MAYPTQGLVWITLLVYSVPASAGAECPTNTGWTLYSGICYKYISDNKFHSDAIDACTGHSAEMTSLKNDGDIVPVYNALSVSAGPLSFWSRYKLEKQSGITYTVDTLTSTVVTVPAFSDLHSQLNVTNETESCIAVTVQTSVGMTLKPCTETSAFICETLPSSDTSLLKDEDIAAIAVAAFIVASFIIVVAIDVAKTKRTGVVDTDRSRLKESVEHI